MPTISQQANILAKAGVAVPPFPARRLPVQERYMREGVRIPQEELDADKEQRLAALVWTEAVAGIYATFVAARAAASRPETEFVGNHVSGGSVLPASDGNEVTAVVNRT